MTEQPEIHDEPIDLFDGLDAMGWADDALCAQTDPENWFPEKGGSTAVAKATCMRCLVRAECLDHALARPEKFGIWGGLTVKQRNRLLDTITDLESDS